MSTRGIAAILAVVGTVGLSLIVAVVVWSSSDKKDNATPANASAQLKKQRTVSTTPATRKSPPPADVAARDAAAQEGGKLAIEKRIALTPRTQQERLRMLVDGDVETLEDDDISLIRSNWDILGTAKIKALLAEFADRTHVKSLLHNLGVTDQMRQKQLEIKVAYALSTGDDKMQALFISAEMKEKGLGNLNDESKAFVRARLTLFGLN